MRIEILIPNQALRFYDDAGKISYECAISSAINGVGERRNSECTPRGWHIVRAKIGGDCPVNTIFMGRRPNGEIYTPAYRERYPERDWILTRILWLSGLEPGRNRLGDVDTMRRYIYIHGAPDEDPMGIPRSHGCIKVRNTDIVELYNRVPIGTRVNIIGDE